MSWLKREFITQAFEEIGLASYVFDLSPEQLQSALRKLDMMMATWDARGIRLGYPIPSTAGGSSLTEDSGVPDRANEAIVTNLAIRLAPSVGKTVSMDLKAIAKQAFDGLLAVAALPAEMQMPSGTPAGAGNAGRTFLDDPVDTFAVDADGELGIE